MKKRFRFLILMCMCVWVLAACGAKQEKVDIIPSQTPNAEGTPTEAPATPTPKATPTEVPAAPTPKATPTVTPTPTAEPRMVQGYDIGPATSGIALKDGFEKYFKVGTALNGAALETGTLRSEAMTEITKYHFNTVTYSNMMKSCYLLNQNGSIKNVAEGNPEPAVSFDTVIEGLEFCKENGIGMRGHTLVWHTQVPDWFFREGYTNDGAYVDRDTMLMRMESYIRQVLTFTQENYPGVIYCWDVVNEAVEIAVGSYETESGFKVRTQSGDGRNLWYDVIGWDYWVKAFEYARKYAAPDVKLFYNDYNTFMSEKTDAICKLASYLKERGLIDGIGMQGYMDLSFPNIYGSSSFATALTRFGKLGLEVQITELSISCPDNSAESYEKQAKRYRSVFSALIANDTDHGGEVNITSVTFFGLMDQYMFYAGNTDYARLFDKDLQPKPAFYSILDFAE